MALAATDFSSFFKIGLGNSRWLFVVKYTGPASYAGPEVLTQALARQVLQGIGYVDAMIPTEAFNGSGANVTVTFEPTNASSNVGNIRFYNSMLSHTHNVLLKGGLTIQDAAGQSATNVFGKASATDATIASSSSNGGVVASAATVAGAEVASTTNLSAYSCWFIGIGVE